MYLAALYVPVAYAGFLMCATFLSWAWNDPLYVLFAITLGLQRTIEAAIPQAAAAPQPVARPRGRGNSNLGPRRIAG
jgi:hypothetical protein